MDKITDTTWEAPVDKKQLMKKYGLLLGSLLLTILIIATCAAGIHHIATRNSNNYPTPIVAAGIEHTLLHPTKTMQVEGTVNIAGQGAAVNLLTNTDNLSGTITYKGNKYTLNTTPGGMLLKTTKDGWSGLNIDSSYDGWVFIPGDTGWEMFGLTPEQILGKRTSLSKKKGSIAWGDTTLNLENGMITHVDNGLTQLDFRPSTATPTSVTRGKAVLVKKNGVNTVVGVSKPAPKKTKK